MTACRTLSAWVCLILNLPLFAAPKSHTVVLGHFRSVPYTTETSTLEMKVRPLVIDGQVKEWTVGSLHDVTDRSFVVRRVMRINDALPGERSDHWVWQQGPWLLVDRITGRISVLHLPDYDPAISEVVWFRDYAAYCGLTANGRKLDAVVTQIAGRRPILAKEIKPWSPEAHSKQVCDPAVWQRAPIRITFRPVGSNEISFDLFGNSAVLLEEDEEDSFQRSQ
jgi:hypothetical protein